MNRDGERERERENNPNEPTEVTPIETIDQRKQTRECQALLEKKRSVNIDGEAVWHQSYANYTQTKLET